MSAVHLPPPPGNAVRLSRAWGLAPLPEDSSLFLPVCSEAEILRILGSLKATSLIRLERANMVPNTNYLTVGDFLLFFTLSFFLYDFFCSYKEHVSLI